MKYFILTGTSRGIGEALAHQLISDEHHLFCISRTPNESLAARKGLDYIQFDLNHTHGIETVMKNIFDKIDPAKAESIYLVNNAAVVAPLAPIENSPVEQIIDNIHINLLAPIVLTSLFIHHSSHLPIDKRILNISSASAKHLVPGMSCYSTAKAGLDVFSSSVALEQGSKDNAVKVVSVWPGMIDTHLQEEARNADQETFASSVLFNQVKDKGMLTTPQFAAEQIKKLLLGDRFTQGALIENLYA
jgi:benzil reductase ((S)-benzoin forming)